MIFSRPCENLTSRSVIRQAALLCCLMPLSAALSFAEELPDQEKKTKGNDPAGKKNRKLNVIAHWKLDKGIAGGAASASQLIEDSSGNSRHGRAVGGPLYHSVELPTTNLALAFDGRDDRISVADGPLFYLTKSFTIEAWVEIAFYPASRQHRAFIVFRGDNRAGFDPWFLAIEESGQLQFLMADSLNRASVVRSPQPLPTRTFLHVAAVFDHKTGKQSLFVDGWQVASTQARIRAGGPLGGTGPGIGIGGRQDLSHQGFRGSIAELRISASALTRSQFLLPLPDSDSEAP